MYIKNFSFPRSSLTVKVETDCGVRLSQVVPGRDLVLAGVLHRDISKEQLAVGRVLVFLAHHHLELLAVLHLDAISEPVGQMYSIMRGRFIRLCIWLYQEIMGFGSAMIEQWKTSVDPSPSACRMVGFLSKVGAIPSTWLQGRRWQKCGEGSIKNIA